MLNLFEIAGLFIVLAFCLIEIYWVRSKGNMFKVLSQIIVFIISPFVLYFVFLFLGLAKQTPFNYALLTSLVINTVMCWGFRDVTCWRRWCAGLMTRQQWPNWHGGE